MSRSANLSSFAKAIDGGAPFNINGTLTVNNLISPVNLTVNSYTANVMTANTMNAATVSATTNFNLPVGNTSNRPVSPSYGNMRYNSQTGIAEVYTTDGWVGIDITPSIATVSGIINFDTSTNLTVTGSNFKSGAIVSIEGAAVNNVSRNLVTTFVSSSTLTANTNATNVNYVGGAVFSLKVTNPSSVSTTLSPAGTVDRDPIWSTASGSVATIYDAASYANVATLVASDPDGSAVTYTLSSGSLPTGTSLNSSTGVISGTAAVVAANTTYPFDVTASSNGTDIVRSFNIIVLPGRDGTTAARATTPYFLRNTIGNTTNGLYWIKTNNTYNGITMSSAVQAYIYFNLVDSKDWVLMMELNQSGSQGGSVVTSTTPQDTIGYNVPWKGFNLRKDGTDYYGYFANYRSYNTTSDTTTAASGPYTGYRVFLGNSGGHGWYNTSQTPCNWGSSSGAVGAGYDGSCGGYPGSLRMGFGTGGANYNLSTGNWRSLIWMDTAV